MTENQNCKQLSAKINTIKTKSNLLSSELKKGNIQNCLEIKSVLLRLLEEIKNDWLLEILSKENIEKQYDGWEEMYADLDRAYQLPSKQQLFEFLGKDFEFTKLMREKERQGLTKLIIAPAPGFYSLKDLADQTEEKVKACGASYISYYAGIWIKMLANEHDIRYFGTIDGSNPNDPKTTGGVTGEEIKSNPDNYSICNGWIVSFTTDELNILYSDKSNLETGEDRRAMRTGLTGLEYSVLYFSDMNESYIGEKAMIPQEHFALFLRDLHEKYVKIGKKIESKGSDLLDRDSSTWFISTYLPEEDYIPSAGWASDYREYFCDQYHIYAPAIGLGVRGVVRKNIES